MKRRLLSIVTVLALCLALLPTAAVAAEVAGGSCNGNLTWTLDDAGVLTISGTGAIQDWNYTSPPWRSYKDSITSIVMESGITSIGDGSFRDLKSVTSVTIPEGVTRIGDSAFRNCDSLTGITLPENLTSIGISAFSPCGALTSITIPAGVTSIGQGAFMSCGSLTDITVAATSGTYCSVDGVLFDKEKTTLIQCPAGKAGDYTVPDGVTSIGDHAFRNCGSLTGVTISGSVTSIGASAFSDCKQLASVTIPTGVTSIGERAFYACDALTDVAVPSGVTSIGDYTFYWCKSLKRVTLPETVTSIGANAFNLCNSLTDITIPEGVTSIGNSVFSSCTGLTSITIPSTVTSLGGAVFSNCLSLESVDIKGPIPSIERWAFHGCEKLKSVTIPDTVTSIGESAFYQCSLLERVTLPAGLTSLGDHAFDCCTVLANVEIPSGITTIGEQVFRGCDGFTEITIPGSVKSIGTGAFAACAKLERIELQSGLTSIGERAFSWCKMATITIPDTVTDMGPNVFYHCADLTSVTLSKNITSIGDGTFSDCSKLTDVTIPEGVTSIGASAFLNCSALTDITIPASVTSIGDQAFYNCGSLKNVTIESENITIGTGNDMLLNFPAAEDADNDGVYELKTASDLFWFAQQVNKGADTGINAKLMNDIDLKDGTARGQGWSPIGSAETPYVGAFDGCGYSVRNLTLTNEALNYQGLFGYVGELGAVSNLGVSGTVTGYMCVGGVCGTNKGTITNCHSAVTVTSTWSIGGGVCGSTYGPVTNCYNTGAVTGDDFVGGVCGESNGATLTNCYNTGAVSGKDYVGGVVGNNDQRDIVRSSILHCYNTGAVTGTGTSVGSVCGYNDLGTITACYYLTGTANTGVGTNVGEGVEVGEAKTAEEFASGEVAYLLQSGQSEQAWGQQLTGDAADALPVLTSEQAKKVSMVTFQANNATHATKYANPIGVGELPDAPAVDAGYTFYRWSQTNAADGAEFKADTPVNSDMTVYAVRQEQYGEESGEHTLTTTYGTAAALDLSTCVGYGGTPATLAAGKFTYAINSGNDALGASVSGDTLTVPDTATAGSYTLSVTATEKEPQISLFSLNNPGTQPVTFTVTVTVNKATPVVNALIPAHLTYTGEAQDLVTSCTTTGGTLQYSTDGAAYSETIPQGTDAGKYTVYYKVVGDENYEDVEARQSDVTIDPKALAGTVTIDGTAAMNETLSAVLSDSAQGVNYQWYRGGEAIDGATGSSYTLAAADVGTAITVTATGTGNYTGVLTSDPTAAVTKALPEITAWPTAAAITYGQALSDSALTGGEASVDGVFAWTTDSAKPAVADSGKTYSVTFTPSVDGYVSVTGEVTVTVNKKVLTPSISGTATTKTYDGTTTVPDGLAIALEGIVDGDDVTAAATGCAYDKADAGDRAITATGITLSGAAAGNYTLSATEVTIAGTILPVQLALTFEDQTISYGAEPTKAVPSVSGAEIAYSYTTAAAPGEPISGWPTDAGTYSVTAAAIAGANYFGARKTITLTIAPKALDPAALTVKVEPVHYEYTGAAITPTKVTVLDGETVIPATEYTLAYENNTHVGQAAVTVTDNEAGNYTFTGSASGSFEITKPSLAADDVTVTLSESEYTYDGTAKAPAVTVVKDGVTVNADEYDVSYSNTNGGDGDHTSAGTVTVTVTAKESGDYFGSNSATFAIKPKPIAGAEITLAADPTYDGTEQTMTVASVTVDGLDVTYAVASGDKGTDAGAYTLALTGTGNFAGTAEAVWHILPASLETAAFATIENQSFTGGDVTPKPAVTWSGKTLEAGTDFTYTYANNRYVGTATVNIEGKGNYTGAATAGADFNIVAVADPAVIVDTATVTKGGNTVDLSGNVTGAVGAVSYARKDGSGDVDAQGVYTSPRNSGSATVTVTVAATDLNGDGVNEYTGKTADITVTVTDKTTAALEVTQAGCTFGETLPDPVYTVSGDVIAATMTYTGKTRSGADYAGADAPTEAGTYTVKVVCETATHIYEGTSEPFTVEPKSIDAAEVTLGAALTYNGQSQTQDVTAVTLDGADILSSCDVTDNTATDAGDHTLTVTAKATSNYTGSVTKTFTVERKAITPTVEGVVDLDYTGSQLTQSGVVVKDGETALAVTDYEIVYGENITAGADAGSLTVKAKAEGNYSFADTTVTFTINKIAYPGVTSATAEARFGEAQSVDLTALLAEGYVLGEVTVASDADAVLNGTPTLNGTALTFTLVDDASKAGKTAAIQVAVTDAANYLPYTVTVTVTVTDKLLQENFKFAESAKRVVYGETLDYPATGAVSGSTVSYVSSDPTVATVDAAGKVTALKAGTATITATASAAGDYAQTSASYTLQVTKATVTMKAIDRSIYTGQTVPDLSAPKVDTDYTVTGLVGEDALVGAVVLKYQQGGEDVTPAKAGTYDIVISGVAEPEGGNYNAIVLLSGKLTITTRPYSGGSSGGSASRKPSVSGGEGGSVTAGQDGSVTITPDEGYQIATVTVNGKEVELPEGGKLTGLKRTDKVVVTFEPIPAPVVPASERFTDVTAGAWYEDAVTYVVEHGLFNGTGDTTFSPDAAMDRGMLATVLYRLENEPEVTARELFRDVADGQYYTQGIAWAADQNIVSGYGNGSFGPDDPITREQLAVMLWRYAGKPTGNGSLDGFTDSAKADAWAADALRWAVSQNILNGKGGGILDPQGQATRAEVAAMIQRFLALK